MASKPYLDKRSGVWYTKARIDRTAGWKPVRLGKHGSPVNPAKPPKKWPAAIDQRWAEVKELEWKADQGIATGQSRETPLAPYVATYLETFRRTKREGSVENLERFARVFLAFADGRKVKTLQAVSKAVCREYLEERIRTVAASSLKTERGFLSPIWSQAVRDELIPSNPWKLVAIPGKSEESKPQFWTPEQVGAIVAACEFGWLADLVIVLVNTGIRISATLAMEWDWVHWEAGTIAVPPREDKAGKGYTVAFPGVARDVLQRRNAASGGDLVFPSSKGGEWSYEWVRNAFGRAVDRAGVPRGTLHDLRHTYGRLLARVAPITVVQASLGHASLAMTQRYTSVSGEEGVNYMEGFGVGEQPKGNAA